MNYCIRSRTELYHPRNRRGNRHLFLHISPRTAVRYNLYQVAETDNSTRPLTYDMQKNANRHNLCQYCKVTITVSGAIGKASTAYMR